MNRIRQAAVWAVMGVVLGGILGEGAARAADLYWDPNNDTEDQWDLDPSNLSWDSGSAGGTPTAWTDGNTARFTTSGGTVPLAANVSTSGIQQNVALSITSPDTDADGIYDYTITNSGGMTNPSYGYPLVTYNVNMNLTGSVTIQQKAVFNGPISGSATVYQQGGSGGVTLAHSNPNFTGNWALDVYRANLTLAADNPLGSGTLSLDGQRQAYGIIASGGARSLNNTVSISTLIDNNNGCAFSGDALTFSGTTTFAGRYSDTNAYAFRMIVSNTTEFSGGVRGLRGSLIKQGTGALVLSGSVTNTGATQVNEGTLLINGTHTGGGTYTVASGATLGGRGTITAPVSVSGKLSPGASIESLATGALTFNGGSTFEVELDSSAALSVAADLVKVTGNLALDGTVQLTLTDLAASPSRFPAGTTLSLINYTGTWDNGLFTYAGNELAEAEQFAAGPTTWQISYAAVAGGSNYVGDYSAGHFVNLLSIPEPASLALVGGALAAALLRRRPAA